MALQSRQTQKNTTSSSGFIPEKYRDLAYILGLIAAIIVFLSPVLFSGGSFGSSDNVASKSFTPYLEKAKQSGDFAHWNPHIFSGLPSFAALLTTGDRWYDIMSKVFFTINRGFAASFGGDVMRIAFFYMVFAAGMYLFMRTKNMERYISFFTAFAATFSTWIIIWIVIGHNTKPIALSMFPYILMCLEKLRAKFSILYSALLIVAVHILSESTHVQMMFYGVCTFGIYLLFELVSRIISKDEPLGVMRSAGILAVAGAIAFGMSADRYLSVMEYKPYSTRGTAPIEQTKGKQQNEEGGFDYEYCTNWSFSPEETITFFVPNYFGYGKMQLKKSGISKAPFEQTYWGQMPFTDAANYMGIFVLGFAFIGIAMYRKDALVQALTVLSVFSVFLSYGKNLPILYDLFFQYVPGFNNFRAPQMALVMIQFAVPILAGYGLKAINDWRTNAQPSTKKGLTIFLAISGGFFLLSLIMPSMVESSYKMAVEGSKKIAPENISAIYDAMASDWMQTGFVMLGAAVLVWLYVAGRLPKSVFVPAIMVLLVIDLWRVDYRGFDYKTGKLESVELRKPEFVSYLEQDKSLYRVADFSYLQMGMTNIPAYFLLQNVHGYHSAKMRVYQDLLDVAGKGGGSAIANMFVLNMLNAKYIVAPEPYFPGIEPVHQSNIELENGMGMPSIVYKNPQVLPRAFFVKSTQVASKIDILHHLRDGDFNPREVAFTEEKIPVAIDTVINDAKANVTQFENHKIVIQTENKGNNLLFVSEVHYPVGWKAYIDGQETPVYKTNFAFRSVVVPPGKHTVEFRYRSENFEMGKTVSLSLNIGVLLLLALGIFIEVRKPKATA